MYDFRWTLLYNLCVYKHNVCMFWIMITDNGLLHFATWEVNDRHDMMKIMMGIINGIY